MRSASSGNSWYKVVAVVTMILLPIVTYGVYRYATRLPDEIRIAGGPEAGLYKKLAVDIAKRLNTLSDKTRRTRAGGATVDDSPGSLNNFHRLLKGEVDFAFYQPGVADVADESEKEAEGIAFVANLYMQPAHLFVRKDLNLQSDKLFGGLRGKRVAIGIKESGDYAMSNVILEHLGLEKEEFEVMFEGSAYDEKNYYTAVLDGFEKATLDAAIITIGEVADVFEELVKLGTCEIVAIPNCTALTREHVYLTEHTIPAGRYGVGPNALPLTEIETVASGAQLLTRTDVPSPLVKTVTRIVLSKDFAREHHLKELFEDQGHAFARQKPEFPVHQGALEVYGPEFDIHLFETWEAAYSLAASGIIMAFVAFRWLTNRRLRKLEHKLDRYIRALLDIERRQMPLDNKDAATDKEVVKLQELLDEVTVLRQEALGEFTAHELQEDRASDCFINMCHALSHKINAKLSRQRLDLTMAQLLKQERGEMPASAGSKAATAEGSM